MIYKQMVEDNTVRALQARRGLQEVVFTLIPQKLGVGAAKGRKLEGTSSQWCGTSFLEVVHAIKK